MPSRYSSEGSKSDAYDLAEQLGIDIRTVAIEPAFDAFLGMLAPSFADRPADLTEENLQSRIRGTTLMALSNKFNWMVLTTGGYAVIKDVLKTTVYDLCEFVNERAGREVIPSAIITKPPSAELRPDQRDDQSLPPYEVLDPILELYVERDRTAAEIIAMGRRSARTVAYRSPTAIAAETWSADTWRCNPRRIAHCRLRWSRVRRHRTTRRPRSRPPTSRPDRAFLRCR